jgi:uncharacterized protein YggE
MILSMGRVVTIGEGTATAEPDEFVLHFNVAAVADGVADALDQLADLSDAVAAVLDELHIERRRRATTDYRVHTHYDDERGAREGYEAVTSLRIALAPAAQVASVAGALAERLGDALRIDGVRAGIAARGGLEADARADAVRNARTQAEEIATAAGARVGGLVSLVEGGFLPAGMLTEAGMARGMRRAASVEPGEMAVRVTVTGTWELAEGGT